MTFEGVQLQGSVKIMEKLTVSFVQVHRADHEANVCVFLQSLSFQKINRIITAVDSQPMFDGGVLINVLGRLQVG